MTENKSESLKDKIARMKALADKKLTDQGIPLEQSLKDSGSGIQNSERFAPPSGNIPDNFIQAQVKFPEFDAQQFFVLLTNLTRAVEANAPGIMAYLQEISNNLLQFPELVHILNNEQLHAITSGIFFETDHNMATVITRSKTRELTIDEGKHLFL